ncbi:hypothetical protein [uncultured Serinicoccus sp.]|uniref:hypothetical protein n=1 Tax=uncultured Serinicoccus sp. TaxID=735514 RepID=UPI002633F83D|nr:hypothetical protein [uncultured Serinicoccus sp.]
MRRGGGRSQALGGVAAQGTQAGASFVLQLLAVRLLGVEGLGIFASLYALIVLGAAINSGFVGDSLTVLGRHETPVRAGLQAWGLLVPVAFGLVLGTGAWVVGALTGWLVIALALAAVVFLVEDLMRRLLMATFRFGRIVAVDLCGLTGTVLTLALIEDRTSLQVGHFFAALVVGQSVALGVAVLLLPTEERRWAPMKEADLRVVARYGSWRAVQQSIKPGLLAVVRIAGVALAGAAAVGQLEAARIYLSPAIVVIGGLASVMMARYAVRKTASLRTLIRSADRSAVRIVGASAAFLTLALLVEPWAGPLLTDGEFQLPLVALIGWATYAAATGFAAPYTTLAAVRGSQPLVVAVRAVESTVAGMVVVTVIFWSGTVVWAPLLLGLGSMVGGLWLRSLLKRHEGDLG